MKYQHTPPDLCDFLSNKEDGAPFHSSLNALTLSFLADIHKQLPKVTCSKTSVDPTCLQVHNYV